MRLLQVAQTQEAVTSAPPLPEVGSPSLAVSRLKTSHTVQANGALELWFSDSMDAWRSVGSSDVQILGEEFQARAFPKTFMMIHSHPCPVTLLTLQGTACVIKSFWFGLCPI